MDTKSVRGNRGPRKAKESDASDQRRPSWIHTEQWKDGPHVAVYEDGHMLCVCLHQKGADAVGFRLSQLRAHGECPTADLAGHVNTATVKSLIDEWASCIGRGFALLAENVQCLRVYSGAVRFEFADDGDEGIFKSVVEHALEERFEEAVKRLARGNDAMVDLAWLSPAEIEARLRDFKPTLARPRADGAVGRPGKNVAGATSPGPADGADGRDPEDAVATRRARADGAKGAVAGIRAHGRKH